MIRSRDLDDIAPDDMVVESALEVEPTVALKKEKVKLKETVKSEVPKKEKTSKDDIWRQKVYELIKGKTTSPFSSFLARPHVFNFKEHHENEEIILVLRRHWATNVAWILTAFVMIFVPVLFIYMPILSFFSTNFKLILVLFWYLGTLAFTFEKFISWYFNVYIITDERVIDVDFMHLIDKRISEAEISKIQDITYRTIGVPQTFFNYGTIRIQTAAGIAQIEFELTPNPNLVVKVLQLLRQEEAQEALDGRLR